MYCRHSVSDHSNKDRSRHPHRHAGGGRTKELVVVIKARSQERRSGAYYPEEDRMDHVEYYYEVPIEQHGTHHQQKQWRRQIACVMLPMYLLAYYHQEPTLPIPTISANAVLVMCCPLESFSMDPFACLVIRNRSSATPVLPGRILGFQFRSTKED